MSFESDEFMNHLLHENKTEFERKLIKNFDKNLLMAGILGILLLVAILFFDITITSRVGFILFLIPLFFILIVAIEISHNMSVAAMKSEQLVRLNIALLKIQASKTPNVK